MKNGMRPVLLAVLALVCVVLAGTGCRHDEEEPAPFRGGEIEFSVSTGYENAGGTGDEADLQAGKRSVSPGDGAVANGADLLAPDVPGLDGPGGAAMNGAGLPVTGAVPPGGSVGAGPDGGDLDGPGGAPQTRTAYSGYSTMLGSERYERIDWVDGDRISIWCDQVSDPVKRYDYAVSSHTTSNVQSYAAIAPVSSAPHWGAGTHTFYAMYPAASTPGVDPSRVSLNGNELKGFIPAVQTVTYNSGLGLVPDMKYAYMFAATTMASTGGVPLYFKPMFTAFQFIVRNDEYPTLTLYSFELTSSSHALTGNFTATVTAATGENAACTYAVPPRTEENSKITVDFGEEGITFSKGVGTYIMVFALPQDVSNLTAKFYTSRGPRSLPLSHAGGESIMFSSCQKYRFAPFGLPRLYTYNLVLSSNAKFTQFSGGTFVTTLRSSKTRLADGQITPEPWSVAGYYADPGCTVPYNGNAALKPDWLTLSAYSGSGSIPGEALNGTCAASPAVSTTSQNTYNLSQAFLSSAPEVGSPTRYWNLANPVDGGSYIRESANCYIVNAPGYYRIPLVIGNGIKNNQLNRRAANADNFVNYLDEKIVSTFTDKISICNSISYRSATAFVIREEGKLLDVVDESSWILAPVPGTSSAITFADSRAWLNFRIRRENIRPGSVVIGVRDKQGRIMWSWHIWITDYIPRNYSSYSSSGLKDIPVTNHTGHVYTFMPRNLGEVTYGTTLTKTYNERRVYVKIVQPHANDNTTWQVLHVTQAGMVEHVENIHPLGTHSPLYQFGRKDPFIGGNGWGLEQPTFYGVWPIFHGYHREGHTVGWTIQNPWRWNSKDGFNEDWFSGETYYNWWNNLNPTNVLNDNPVQKTIYDPSPAGYHVPTSNAFTGFTTTGEAATEEHVYQFNVKDMDGDNVIEHEDFDISQGWHFYTDASRTKTIHFIAQGARAAYDGGYGFPLAVGRYRTCVAIDRWSAYLLGFEWYRVCPYYMWADVGRSDAMSVRAVQD